MMGLKTGRIARSAWARLLSALTFGLTMLIATAVMAAAESGPPKPIKQEPPEYPRGAVARGIEGVVNIEFSIDGEGNVVAPHVVSATPPGVFDAAALRALSKWKYEARGSETAGMKVNIVFRQE